MHSNSSGEITHPTTQSLIDKHTKSLNQPTTDTLTQALISSTNHLAKEHKHSPTHARPHSFTVQAKSRTRSLKNEANTITFRAKSFTESYME